MIINQAQPHWQAVIALLSANQLPVADLPETLEHFIVAIADAVVVGVAGLEVYEDCGLLRSLAVSADYRNQGVAAKLLRRIDTLASLKGLTELYLLTETAPGYFEKKGFQEINRTSVPEALKASSEFSYVCPQSAVVMKKQID